jgi:hypothetical protein
MEDSGSLPCREIVISLFFYWLSEDTNPINYTAVTDKDCHY